MTIEELRPTATDSSARLGGGPPALANDQRYPAFVEALPALIVITSATGEIDEISERYAEYTGLSLEQALRWEKSAPGDPGYQWRMRIRIEHRPAQLADGKVERKTDTPDSEQTRGA